MERKRRRLSSLDFDLGRSRPAASSPSTSRGRAGGGSAYDFQLALPNGACLALTVRNPTSDLLLMDVVKRVRADFSSAVERSRALPQPAGSERRRRLSAWWRGKSTVFFVGHAGRRAETLLRIASLDPDKQHIFTIQDGPSSQHDGATKRNWNRALNADLFAQCQDKYTSETALTALIDKSICAGCSMRNGRKRLVCLDVTEDYISIFDTGDGMDENNKHSILNWGRRIADLDLIGLAPGGKPPYFKSCFGKIGYGGYTASLHLGRSALVSSKREESDKLYLLHFGRATLHNSGSSCCEFSWRLLSFTQSEGGIIDASSSNEFDPSQKSCTRIEIFDHDCRVPVELLQCRLKDIYFPYIQSDDMSTTGKTMTPILFQVNGVNLAEVEGGEVATINLHSCNGPEFVLQLHLTTEGDRTQRDPGVRTSGEANARLKCVYLPFIKGKESIDRILGIVKSSNFRPVDDCGNTSYVFVRWLGRLLPNAHWDRLPFMNPRLNRGENQILKRCFRRVICFIDTDGGFISTPLKTNLCPDSPFTKALKHLGAASEDEKEVRVKISVCEKLLPYPVLEREYKNWVLQMHDLYDQDFNCGIDEPILLVDPPNIKELRLTSIVVRVHKKIKWEGKTWESGQKIKILKGTCPGYQKTNFFATLEYFLLEGLDGDAGGEARIVCRPLGVDENEGCILRSNDMNPRLGAQDSAENVLGTNDTNPTLELHGSLTFPISVIDAGKFLVVSNDEWNNQVEKFKLQSPSSKELLTHKQCQDFTMDTNMIIKACDKGELRPSYEEFKCKNHKSINAHVPCQVKPRPLDQVVLLSPEESIELHPGYVFTNIKLEMLDAYGKHVEEGFEVNLLVDGFQLLDCCGLSFKVDNKGYIDLSGRLKVTGGYGKSVSICVLSLKEEVFKKEFQIGKKELRLASKVPEFHVPGSKLEDLVFEITNSDGVVDESVHDTKYGLSHLLKVQVKLLENESFQLFSFQHGRCVVPALNLPTKEGRGWLVATHSGHPELCLRLKVTVTRAIKEEYGSSLTDRQSSSIKDDRIMSQSQYGLAMLFGSSNTPFMVDNRVASTLEDFKNLEEVVEQYGVLINNHEMELKMLSLRKSAVEEDIIALKAFRSKKEDIMEKIESRDSSVAALYCKFSRMMATEERKGHFVANVVGLVALLGTVPCPSLSQMLAAYLGEDRMLGIVSKSSAAQMLLDYENLLDSLKSESFKCQLVYICLEDLRPYTGEIVEGDLQRRLALPSPLLKSGMAPPGFRGYAVNMIDLDISHMDTEVGRQGYGLRETLFYHLFGELQVYETRDQMMKALACIKNGAISLDGGIVKGNGEFVLGIIVKPEICFPVLALDRQLDLSSGGKDIIKQIEAKETLLKDTSDAMKVKKSLISKCKMLLQQTVQEHTRLCEKKESLFSSQGKNPPNPHLAG